MINQQAMMLRSIVQTKAIAVRTVLLIVFYATAFPTNAVAQTLTKSFYLSDPSQSLDRVSPAATSDATVSQSASLTPTSQYLYVLRGGSRTDFYRYNISGNNWNSMAATPGTVSRGGALASDGTYIYALRGAGTDFWRYNPGSNSWSVMAAAPSAVGAGACLVRVNGAIYAFKGGITNTFWKYTIATNIWTVLSNAPDNVGWGGSLATNGTDIFAIRGNASTAFWKYTVATNTWSSLTVLPATADYGASLTFDGTNLYALRGGGFNNFYRYSLTTNSWTSLNNTSNTIGKGGSLIADDPNVYALRGNASSNFWNWNGASWSSLSAAPANIDSGAAIIKMGVTPKTTSFTQTPAMCGSFVVKAGTITVTNYISIQYGTMPANPAITATLRYGTNTILALNNPVYNSTTGLLTWTGTLASDITIPAGQALALDISTSQPNVSFKIDYDSQAKPSKIDLQTTSNISVSSVSVYTLSYPLGLPASSVQGGTTKYIRVTVTNPTGFADITGITVTVTPPGNTITCNQVAASGCTKIYEGAWNVPVGLVTATINATAKDGFENTITATKSMSINGCANCPPTANEDFATGNGGEPLVIDVLANDTDPNNDINPASLTVTVQPKNGDVIIDNNKITYLPNGTFQGYDTLTYEICDKTLLTPLCTTTKVYINILAVAFNVCADVTQPKTYYMPYAENQAITALRRSANVSLPSSNIRTVISIKVSYPGMKLIWDHWEDGYESNITTPVQNSTEVWGDGNIFNGIAPGYPNDIIPPGGSIVLDNTMPTPRVTSNIFFDGRDKMYSSGQVSVTQVCGEPSQIALQCMKTNVTAYPNEYGKSFTLPVGQDLPSRDFKYVALFIRAAENNTTVRVDRNNDGSFSNTVVLNEGEVLMVDENTAPSGTKITSGCAIVSDKPIGVDAHFAGVDNYSSREIPLFPATWYSNTYYTPVPTTGPGTTAPLDTAVVMLYNSLNRPINIDWTSGMPSSGTIALGANSSYRFAMPLSATAAYKFTNPTKESFVAIEIVDSYTPGGGGNDGSSRDWSFNLISEGRLTDFASVAWAPGSTDMSRNDNPIWVTPVANTTVYVKYDGDVLNGSNTSPCGLKYDVAMNVNYLNYIKIKDNSDNDQSGTAVYTCNGVKLAAVYGEDPATAVHGNPSWDVGSTIQPFCKEKMIIANDDYAVTMTNTPVTIKVLKNDEGFLAVINPATVGTEGLMQPQHGTIAIVNGNIIYTPFPGFTGLDTFQYQVCSTPTPVVCDIAYVYITVGNCPSPTGQNIMSGQVFLDKNADGIKNDGGTGIAPATIYLYVDGNCNNTINANELIDSTTVDINGYYQFVKAPEKIIADNFDQPGGGSSCASGSDGNTPWKSNWYDGNDASSGFCVSPVKTNAETDVEIIKDSVFGFALRLDDANKYAIREFNMQNATKAFLNFSYRKGSTTLTPGEYIYVQLSADGNNYNTIYTITGNSTYNSDYIDVTNLNFPATPYNAGNKTYLRFITSGNVDEGDIVFFDNISLQFLQYDQCYIAAINTPSLLPNTYLTTAASKSFTFNSAATCASNMDFGVKRISTNSVNDENSTWQNAPVSGTVKHNDFDQENNSQSFNTFLSLTTLTVLPAGSIVSGTDKSGNAVANAGTFTYDIYGNYTLTPTASFTGTVTIPYKICDNGSPSFCDTSYLSITVDPLPAAATTVIANNDEDISYGETITGNLLHNDRDPKKNTFSVTLFRYDTNSDGKPDITTTAGNMVTVSGMNIYNMPVANAGTLTVTANGEYTFTPAAGFAGRVDASYTITNSAGATATASLHIEVLPDINGLQNDPPFAGDDFAYTSVNQPVSGSFIANDRDNNNDSLSFSGVTINAAQSATAIGSAILTNRGGSVQFYTNGTYVYTPPLNYVGPDYVSYTVCDVTSVSPQPLCATAILHTLIVPGISISGKVWDDGNGNVIPEPGFENATNAGGTLYVHLVDDMGYVVAVAKVAADGTYSFANIKGGNDYSLVLSATQGAVGVPSPIASLPPGWVNTGETRNGLIDYGSVGVIDNRFFGWTSVSNYDFGIEQLPSSVPFYVNIPQPKVGDFVTLNGGSNPPVLSGKDAEDCTDGCTLDFKNLIIDSIPDNAELYYNGVLVTAGQLILNFNPDKLQIRFTAVTIGSNTTGFYYSFVDSAGKKDPVTALYSLNWLILLPAKGLTLTANRMGDHAILNWKTLSEINSDYFEIERSIDGRNFSRVGVNIKAAGNSDAEKNYQENDNVSELKSVLVYYRIKLKDINGKLAYSNVATVRMPENGALVKISPNPFVSEININISVEETTPFNIKMVDMAGRTISTSQQKISKESPAITLRYLNNLVRGIYIVELVDAQSGKKHVFKLEKAN